MALPMASDAGRWRWRLAAVVLLAALALAVALPRCADARLDRITVTSVDHPGASATAAAVSREGR